MGKIVFVNKVFYYLLISYILLLLLYNTFVSILESYALGIIPITIQTVLLILIFIHSRYAKLSIIIWSAVFVIGGYGLHIIADLLEGFGNNFSTFKLYSFLYSLINLAIGILIFDFTRRTTILVSHTMNINVVQSNEKDPVNNQ